MERFERYAPLTGALAVALWIVGVVLVDGDMPGDKAPGAEISAWFDDKAGTILLGMTCFGLGSAALVWFLGTVASRLRARIADGRLPGIMLVGGVAAIALVTMAPGSYAAGALASDNLGRTLDAGAAEALFVLGQGFFLAAEFVAVAFMAAAGLALLRSGLVARLVRLGDAGDRPPPRDRADRLGRPLSRPPVVDARPRPLALRAVTGRSAAACGQRGLLTRPERAEVHRGVARLPA